VRRALEICVENANHAILGASLSNPQYAGMGTTLVVAVFHGSRLILGHIGDSRCYRLRDGALQQITRDHSWLQEQVDAGLLTAQQAALSSNRNLVTRALGVEPNVLMEVNEFQVAPNDLFLLCSTGSPTWCPIRIWRSWCGRPCLWKKKRHCSLTPPMPTVVVIT